MCRPIGVAANSSCLRSADTLAASGWRTCSANLIRFGPASSMAKRRSSMVPWTSLPPSENFITVPLSAANRMPSRRSRWAGRTLPWVTRFSRRVLIRARLSAWVRSSANLVRPLIWASRAACWARRALRSSLYLITTCSGWRGGVCGWMAAVTGAAAVATGPPSVRGWSCLGPSPIWPRPGSQLVWGVLLPTPVPSAMAAVLSIAGSVSSKPSAFFLGLDGGQPFLAMRLGLYRPPALRTVPDSSTLAHMAFSPGSWSKRFSGGQLSSSPSSSSPRMVGVVGRLVAVDVLAGLALPRLDDLHQGLVRHGLGDLGDVHALAGQEIEHRLAIHVFRNLEKAGVNTGRGAPGGGRDFGELEHDAAEAGGRTAVTVPWSILAVFGQGQIGQPFDLGEFAAQ